mmetsp:Transcript_7999/g.20400  ORF Transcript_7999/g.20400 Transcript_7999/m.20400 type:complete len:203 (-) Transcript_7999:791-1399(-)
MRAARAPLRAAPGPSRPGLPARAASEARTGAARAWRRSGRPRRTTPRSTRGTLAPCPFAGTAMAAPRALPPPCAPTRPAATPARRGAAALRGGGPGPSARARCWSSPLRQRPAARRPPPWPRGPILAPELEAARAGSCPRPPPGPPRWRAAAPRRKSRVAPHRPRRGPPGPVSRPDCARPPGRRSPRTRQRAGTGAPRRRPA